MFLEIDMAGDIPIYQQIRNQIVFGVATGALKAGQRLPTVRQLASDIGVNPMTVSKAYSLLKQEGMIVMDRRHGARISTPPPESTRFPSEDFDQKAALFISEACMKGVSKEALKAHLLDLIDRIYQQKEVLP